jgi:hypothetical protein
MYNVICMYVYFVLIAQIPFTQEHSTVVCSDNILFRCTFFMFVDNVNLQRTFNRPRVCTYFFIILLLD